jgi:hypothetical protein
MGGHGGVALILRIFIGDPLERSFLVGSGTEALHTTARREDSALGSVGFR